MKFELYSLVTGIFEGFNWGSMVSIVGSGGDGRLLESRVALDKRQRCED